jgi:hypothetical protein
VRIFSSEEDVYHPDHLLADQLCDGQHVTVVLGHSLALQGQTGRAALEGFPLLAFNKAALPEAGRAKAWGDMQHVANARKEQVREYNRRGRGRCRARPKPMLKLSRDTSHALEMSSAGIDDCPSVLYM